MPTVVDRVKVQELIKEGGQLVEVLGFKQYSAEHLPGAINIPLKKLDRPAVTQLDAHLPVIVYCYDYT